MIPNTFFHSLDIYISPARDDSEIVSVCAIHTRIGRDAPISNEVHDTDANGEMGNFFNPKIVLGDESLTYCRHWSIVARAAQFKGHNDSVHLFALPLGLAVCFPVCIFQSRFVLRSFLFLCLG